MIRLNDIYPAIQGEGCHAGRTMVLIRLQGCGVGCPWCDTKETWVAKPEEKATDIVGVLGTNPRWAAIDPDEIASFARDSSPNISWALVTGGEPAEQDLTELVKALHAKSFLVAIETSGTALGHVGAKFDWVCVSPKFDMPGGKPVLPEATKQADEIKAVIGKTSDIETLDKFLATNPGKPGCEICLQPLSTSKAATELCMKTVMERGWRLSVQTHKYLGLR